MLKVKLARFGKKNQPHYRIVVNEARDKRDGSYVALIGHYAPTQSPKILEVNLEEYKKWLGVGAQPTDTVASLIKRFESGTPFPEKKKQLSKKAQAKVVAAKEAEAEAKNKPAEKEVNSTTTETPKETEVKTEKEVQPAAEATSEDKTKAETEATPEVKTEKTPPTK